MAFLQTLPASELHRYHSVVTQSARVRSHLDMLTWLQGDLQRYLPHDIMIAAWGDFHKEDLQFDIISAITDVRSKSSSKARITPLLLKLVTRWNQQGNTPFAFHSDDHDFLHEVTGWECTLGNGVYKMDSALVHGICDKRANHECLYIAFRSNACFTELTLDAMSALIPFIDSALRQVDLLPQLASIDFTLVDKVSPQFRLSKRELEILHWVTIGKTNPEIGSILFISEFTVKNHLKRIYNKMNVSNRAQAVGKVNAMAQTPFHVSSANL